MKVNIGRYKGFQATKPRTVKVKIEEWDTWDLFSTLSSIIAPALKQFIETNSGSPRTDDDDVPVAIKSTSAEPPEREWDTDEFFHDRWKYILGEMYFAFDAINKDLVEEASIAAMKSKTGDAEIAALEQRIQNGLRLFGKYYQNLWD